jgi:hypothetical protein
MARVKQPQFPRVTISTDEGLIVYSALTDVAFSNGIEFDGTHLGQRVHVVSNAPFIYEEKV